MKKLLLVATLVASSTACSTVSAGLFNRSPKPDQKVVESFVRANDVSGAREYLARLGVPEYEVLARVQLAKDALAAK